MEEFMPSVKVIFCLSAYDFNLEEVTNRLGIIPTEARRRSDFPLNGLVHTEWSFEIEERNCMAISVPFKQLLTHLKNKENIIESICDEFSADICFIVVIHMKDGDSPEVVLPREVVTFAASINAEIGFDLYCYE